MFRLTNDRGYRGDYEFRSRLVAPSIAYSSISISDAFGSAIGDAEVSGVGDIALDGAGTVIGDATVTAESTYISSGFADGIVIGDATASGTMTALGDFAGAASGDARGAAYSPLSSFSMVTGTNFNLRGFIQGAIGSVNPQPMGSASTMTQLTRNVTNDTGEIHFTGNQVAALTGLQVYVDSTVYPFLATWTTLPGDETVATWGSPNTAPPLVGASTYLVEIK